MTTTTDTFKPTHVITWKGREIEVSQIDGSLYTRIEWDADDAADWTFGADGTLLFQGQIAAGEHSIRRVGAEVGDEWLVADGEATPLADVAGAPHGNAGRDWVVVRAATAEAALAEAFAHDAGQASTAYDEAHCLEAVSRALGGAAPSHAYYAVCDANGPISVRLEAETLEEALAAFEAGDHRAWIDEAKTDAEEELEIDGADMSETDFGEALEAAGAELVRDLDQVVNAHAGTVAHLHGGWRLWRVEE